MLTLMGLLRRRQDLDLAAFSQHWRTVHRALALRLVAPGIMRGYVQNHRIADLDGLSSAADGVPEVWLDDHDALQRLGSSPEYQEGAALDEPNFMDMGDFTHLLLTPEVAMQGPVRRAVAGRVKMMLFANPAAGRSEIEVDTWHCVAHPLLMPGSEPLRLARHLVAASPSDPPPRFIAVETSWWPDQDSVETAWRHRDFAVAAGLVDIEHMAGMLVIEEPVLWPPDPAETADASPEDIPV